MQINDVLRARGLGVGKKLSGDALAAHVRAGKTFMNADGEQTGTLPVMATTAQTVTPGTANITKPAGIYDGNIVIEGDADLVTGNIRSGVTIFGVTGKAQVVDTTETAGSSATAADILTGKAGFVNGSRIAGSMPNRGAVSITPGTTAQTIADGYHNGSGMVAGDPDLNSANIKAGVNIFGVAGAINVVDTTESVTPAGATHVLAGKKAYVNGALVTGTMADNGNPTITPGTANIVMNSGFYSGGTIQGDTDLISANIKSGINIFGVVGKTEVVDTTEATAASTAAQIRSGRVAFVNGVKLTGTLAVQATAAQTVTPGTTDIIKPAGIYDGPITVAGDADLLTGNIRAGVNLFGVAGKASVVETADATAVAADLLVGDTAYVNGVKITGTMPNNGGAATITPGTADIIKPAGYYSGAQTVIGDPDLIPSNIAQGVSIFGVAGTGYAKGAKVPFSSMGHALNFDQEARVPMKIPNLNMVLTGALVWTSFIDNGFINFWAKDISNYYFMIFDLNGVLVDRLTVLQSVLGDSSMVYSFAYRSSDKTFVIQAYSSVYVYTNGTKVASLAKLYSTGPYEPNRNFKAYYQPAGDYFAFSSVSNSNPDTLIFVVYHNGTSWVITSNTGLSRPAYLHLDKGSNKLYSHSGGNMVVQSIWAVNPTTKGITAVESFATPNSMSHYVLAYMENLGKTGYYLFGVETSGKIMVIYEYIYATKAWTQKYRDTVNLFVNEFYSSNGSLMNTTGIGRLIRGGKNLIYCINETKVWVIDEATWALVKVFTMDQTNISHEFNEILFVAPPTTGIPQTYAKEITLP